MSIKSIIRSGKEKPVGILILSAVLMFFGVFCIIGSIALLALALSVIAPIEGVISVTGNNNMIALAGVIYFGIFGLIQVYLSMGLWKLKRSAWRDTLFLMLLGLISPFLELIGNYTGYIIGIALLPRFSSHLFFAFLIPLLIIFILYFEKYKGTFHTE
jgi:hypothetical protein